ncbi:MAG: hypothetical protein ACE5G1_03850, partial [bacterium]
GIKYYRVSGGLNSHPLFIEALSEVVISQVRLPNRKNATPKARPLQELGTCSADRKTRCHQCEYIAEAIQWESANVAVTN